MFLLWAQNLLVWRDMIDAKKNHSFKEISHFLKTCPHWPCEDKIIEKGENFIDGTTSHKKALHWFKKYKPRSFRAHDVYIQHLPHDEKTHEIRKVWQTKIMKIVEQKMWFQKYKKYLNKKAYQRRVDFLFMNGQKETAISLCKYIPELKPQIEWRLKLIKYEPNMTLPKNATRGMALCYIQYLRNQNNFDEIANILKNFKKDQNTFAKEWSYERVRTAKELVQQKRYQDAYDVLDKSSLRSSSFQNDVLILKVEIGYHLLNYRKKLIHDCELIYHHAEHPSSKSGSAFYLGLIKGEAHGKEWLKKAAHFPTTFFGQKAIEKLKIPSPHFVKVHHKFNTKKNDLTKTLFELNKLSDGELIKLFMSAVLNRDVHDLDHAAAFINAVDKKFGPPYTLWAGFYTQKKFCRVPKLKSLYPTLPTICNPLSLGLIRQESLFDPNARSCANAMGYMQLITKTASRFAGRDVKDKDVFNIKNNLKWGHANLEYLIGYYECCLPLVLAAYNAGEHRVERWLELYGDPRKGEVSIEQWIALIPFKETKHYVMQVLANEKIYAEIV